MKCSSDLDISYAHRFSKIPGFSICYSSKQPFKEVMTHVRQKHGGDLSDLGIIQVMSSSEYRVFRYYLASADKT
jgi:hypothetical protein